MRALIHFMNAATDSACEHLLVARAQLGDKYAFDLLVRKYRYSIFRIISLRTGGSSDADDVVQDAFIRAYHAISRFRGEASFYTWLYRIALNVANTHYHRHGHDTFRPLTEDFEEQDACYSCSALPLADTPESSLHCKQMALALSNALDNLPAQFKKAFDLREIDGLSYEQIARHLGCPVGTVRSRIFRAREIIDKCLNRFGHSL